MHSVSRSPLAKRFLLAGLLLVLAHCPAGAQGLALGPLVDAAPKREATPRRADALAGRLRAALDARGVKVDPQAPLRLTGRIVAATVEDATDIVPFVNVFTPIHLAFVKVEMVVAERDSGKRVAGGTFAEEVRRERAQFKSGSDYGPDFAATALGAAADAVFGTAVETLCRQAGIAYTSPTAARPATTTASAAPTERVLFADDFSTGTLSPAWRGSDLSQWMVAEGVLRPRNRGGVPAIAVGDEEWTDIAVEWRMRRLGGDPGGHAGIKLRQAQGGDLYLFMRPEGLRFAGFGRTESGLSPRPLAFREGEWHHFRVELRGAAATVNVNGQAYGSVGRIANRGGGIAFTLYRHDAEFDDLRVTALAPETAPAAATPPPLPGRRALPLVLLDPHAAAQRDRLVTLTAASAGLESGAAVPDVQVTDPKAPADALPAQYDDLDGDGRISPDDEIAIRVDLPAGKPRVLLLRTGPAGSFAAVGKPAYGVEGELTGAYTVTGRLYRAGGEAPKAAFWVEFPEGGIRFFTLRPWKDETVVFTAAGPARAVLCSQIAVANNGRVRRVISLDAETVALRQTLSAADGKQSAFVQNTEGFWLNTPPPEVVTGTRWRDWSGKVSEATGGEQFRHIFLRGGGSLAQDLLLKNGAAVAVLRQSEPDYTPGMGFVPGHAYTQGGLAFGWRPPIEIRPGSPHRNDLILCPHAPDAGAFREADLRHRRDVLVLAGPEAAAAYAASLHRLLGHLREFAESVTVIRSTGAGEKSDAALLRAPLAGLDAAAKEQARLPEALAAAQAALAGLDLTGACDTALERLAKQGDQLAAASKAHGVETTALRGLLLQARSVLAAARVDFALERHPRGAERLAEAAALVRQARQAARSDTVCARLVPDVPLGPVPPHVVVSDQAADDRFTALGFDVLHPILPWGAHFAWDVFEPEPGQFRFDVSDAVWEKAAKPGMYLVPLVNLSPPKWYTERFGSDSLDLADPKMLGEVPEHMAVFQRYIRTMMERYGKSPQVLAWSLRNEPAYYRMGGATTPALLRALRSHLREQYRDIAALNAVWGTRYASFDEVESPKGFSDNRAAWYDVMIWKAKCLAGELVWEADTITETALCKRTGAKYVPACFGPQAARSGYGVDPWLSGPPQRGVAMCDLYIDGERINALRTSEIFWGAGGTPVLSMETGRVSRDPNESYRWHYHPPKRAMSFAWTLFQHGMYGLHYWLFAPGEEYSGLDWDGAISDYAVYAARMNRLLQAARPALSRVKPRADIGLFFPRATFIQGEREHVATYERLYHLLTTMGYQPRLVSETDFAGASASLPAIVVPDAPYLERSLVPLMRKYVSDGGALLFAGVPALFDEYARPFGREGAGGLADLLGAGLGSPLPEERGKVSLPGERDPVEFANTPAWRVLEPSGDTEVIGKSPEGAALVTERRLGKGRAILVPAPLGRAFGAGVPVAELSGSWRFRFGDSWPQAPGTGKTSTEGRLDRGRVEHWEQPGLDDSGWESTAVPGVWEERGHPDTDGWGWYRKRFTLPADLKGKRVLLVGDTLDDRAEVWVNGERVLTTLSWDQHFSVDVTPHLRCGGENVIVLRIEDTCVLGGVRGSIALVSPDLPVPDARVLSALLARTGVRPSAAPASAPGEVYHAVLTGPDGAYLAVANAEASRSVKIALDIPSGKGEPAEALAAAGRGQVANAFTGALGSFEKAAGTVRVQLDLEPLGVALVPLKPVRPATPSARGAVEAALTGHP